MIDIDNIDERMRTYNDNRNWYIEIEGEESEKELINALYAEVKRLHRLLNGDRDAERLSKKLEQMRKERDLLWDAISFAGTGGNRTEEIAFWHHNLLNMNEAELKEALKEHYE